jgi:hypothetical protein
MMKNKKKKNSNGPRRKRMKRQARLQSAKDTKWLSKYMGKNPVRGYSRYFGVDLLCAINELRILGFAVDEKYEISVLQSIEAKRKQKKHTKEKNELPDYDFQDETFAYIAGYTSGGAPYGVTWEEIEKEFPEENF